jgi:hypothetical protein
MNVLRTTATGTLLLTISAFLLNCGSPPGPGEKLPEGMVWEYGWVDPVVVFGDELVTLVRAERVDSFPVVDKPDSLRNDFSLAFEIIEGTCPVSINLYSADGLLAQPLLVQRLPVGVYRVSLSRPGLRTRGLLPGDFELVAVHCGQTSRLGFAYR